MTDCCCLVCLRPPHFKRVIKALYPPKADKKDFHQEPQNIRKLVKYAVTRPDAVYNLTKRLVKVSRKHLKKKQFGYFNITTAAFKELLQGYSSTSSDDSSVYLFLSLAQQLIDSCLLSKHIDAQVRGFQLLSAAFASFDTAQSAADFRPYLLPILEAISSSTAKEPTQLQLAAGKALKGYLTTFMASLPQSDALLCVHCIAAALLCFSKSLSYECRQRSQYKFHVIDLPESDTPSASLSVLSFSSVMLDCVHRLASPRSTGTLAIRRVLPHILRVFSVVDLPNKWAAGLLSLLIETIVAAPPSWLRQLSDQPEEPEEGSDESGAGNYTSPSTDASPYRWKPQLLQAIAILLDFLDDGPRHGLVVADLDGLLNMLFVEEPLAIPSFHPPQEHSSGCFGKKAAARSFPSTRDFAQAAILRCRQVIPPGASGETRDTALVVLNTLKQLIPRAGPTLSSMLPRIVASLSRCLRAPLLSVVDPTGAPNTLAWDQHASVWRVGPFSSPSLSSTIVAVDVFHDLATNFHSRMDMTRLLDELLELVVFSGPHTSRESTTSERKSEEAVTSRAVNTTFLALMHYISPQASKGLAVPGGAPVHRMKGHTEEKKDHVGETGATHMEIKQSEEEDSEGEAEISSVFGFLSSEGIPAPVFDWLLHGILNDKFLTRKLALEVLTHHLQLYSTHTQPERATAYLLPDADQCRVFVKVLVTLLLTRLGLSSTTDVVTLMLGKRHARRKVLPERLPTASRKPALLRQECLLIANLLLQICRYGGLFGVMLTLSGAFLIQTAAETSVSLQNSSEKSNKSSAKAVGPTWGMSVKMAHDMVAYVLLHLSRFCGSSEMTELVQRVVTSRWKHGLLSQSLTTQWFPELNAEQPEVESGKVLADSSIPSQYEGLVEQASSNPFIFKRRQAASLLIHSRLGESLGMRWVKSKGWRMVALPLVGALGLGSREDKEPEENFRYFLEDALATDKILLSVATPDETNRNVSMSSSDGSVEGIHHLRRTSDIPLETSSEEGIIDVRDRSKESVQRILGVSVGRKKEVDPRDGLPIKELTVHEALEPVLKNMFLQVASSPASLRSLEIAERMEAKLTQDHISKPRFGAQTSSSTDVIGLSPIPSRTPVATEQT